MGYYADHILPRLIHVSMRQARHSSYRSRVISNATGRVLEVGIGSGLNLPFYGNDVREIIGIDSSSKLLDLTREYHGRTFMNLQLIEASAEAIPIDDRSIDTIVTTWTLCSIPAIDRALQEMHRVLKPSGRLLFAEHGRAPEPRVRWWQDHITPMWKRLAGGCHLNRPIEDIIRRAGFRIEHLDRGYMRGPKPMAFMYEGSARPE